MLQVKNELVISIESPLAFSWIKVHEFSSSDRPESYVSFRSQDSIGLCQFHYYLITLLEGEHQLSLIAECCVRPTRRNDEEPLGWVAATTGILDVQQVLPGEESGEAKIES